MACVAVIAAPFALITTAAQVYMFLIMPLGFAAAITARIALNQIKRGAGTRRERGVAVAAYFLGLAPALYLCGMLTYDLARL